MLIPCERCKRHFSEREPHCPFCRHRSRLSYVSAAALSAGALLAGCDQGGGAKKAPTVTEKKPYGTIRGSVTNKEGGSAVEGASVTLTLAAPASPNHAFTKVVPTDASGHYDLGIVDPGSYVLIVSHVSTDLQGYEQRNVTVAAGDDLKHDIALTFTRIPVAPPPYGAPPARRRIV